MNQTNGVEFATTPRLATGVRLHYAQRGDPTGEAIVFLHGYSDSWFSFSRVLPLLSPEYHAFALTQRGQGTQISQSAATLQMTSPPMPTGLWMRSASTKPLSSVLRRELFSPNEWR
jgi:pimeloyl-ACP methyl ester carboxylesterase